MGIYDAISEGVELVERAGDTELVRKLLDARRDVLDLVEENRRLKEENAALKSQLESAGRVRLEGQGPPQNVDEGPYCTMCWDVDRRLVRLDLIGRREGVGTVYRCPRCTAGKRTIV